MKKEMEKYAIWTEDGDCSDPDSFHEYWEMFDSLEDAIDARSGQTTEIYVMRPQLLGTFRRKTTIVQVGKLKKRKRH